MSSSIWILQETRSAEEGEMRRVSPRIPGLLALAACVFDLLMIQVGRLKVTCKPEFLTSDSVSEFAG